MPNVWDPYRPNCPSRELLDRIGDKWSLLVLGTLSDGNAWRFTDLRLRISGVSQKMLTQTLRSLEQDGLVEREAFAEVPPRVEYRLTALGATLRTPVEAFHAWTRDHIEDVLAARTRTGDTSEAARTGSAGSMRG